MNILQSISIYLWPECINETINGLLSPLSQVRILSIQISRHKRSSLSILFNIFYVSVMVVHMVLWKVKEKLLIIPDRLKL